MKHFRFKRTAALVATAFAALAFHACAQTNSPPPAPVPANDPLMNMLIKKGILTQDEAKQIQQEAAASQTNEPATPPPSKWMLSNAIKDIGLFGDIRFRYEYRAADNSPNVQPPVAPRERFRYAVRLGLRGDLYDDFSYGVRFETSSNPRSPWVTFGDDSNPTPSSKASDVIYVGQIYIKWHPADFFEMTVGRMPMPLYTTPMVWDSDICPEGAFEKIKTTLGPVDLFADFAQFDYQNESVSSLSPVSSDVFLMAWQAGGNVKIGKDMSFKAAPVLYTYTGLGSTNGANLGLVLPYTGQGNAGANVNFTGGTAFNQNGINDLMVLEIPAEFDFQMTSPLLGKLQGRFFGDYAINLDGSTRAKNAALAAGLPTAYTHEVKAYQFGFGVGSAGPVYGPMQGLVYGTTSKRNTWETRVYWQHVEQYALDVNLMDSDFFEGRGNLEGVYVALAYSVSDAIIGTMRYGYAHQINKNLGTGGNNSDLPGLNPIDGYRVVQCDLTLRF